MSSNIPKFEKDKLFAWYKDELRRVFTENINKQPVTMDGDLTKADRDLHDEYLRRWRALKKKYESKD